MIRTVVVGRLRTPADDAQADRARLPREELGPVRGDIARVQIEIPDPS